MSYHTLSVIIASEDEKERDFLLNELPSKFPTLKARKVNHQVKGFVAQLDLRSVEGENYEEELEAYLITSSPKFPTLKLALVEVDCFGGRCTSNGKIIKNGSIIQDEPYHHIAHVNLLKTISDDYQAWHFEPFTRGYFEKRGGIWGEISGASLSFVGVGFFTTYHKMEDYRFDMTHNEMILDKQGKFHLYLMEPEPNSIKILGSILDDSEETLNEIKAIIADEISHTNSYVFIDLIEKEEFVKIDHTDEEGMKETFYRHKAFNERPLIPANPAPVAQKRQRQKPNTSQQKETGLSGWFKRNFGKK